MGHNLYSGGVESLNSVHRGPDVITFMKQRKEQWMVMREILSDMTHLGRIHPIKTRQNNSVHYNV